LNYAIISLAGVVSVLWNVFYHAVNCCIIYSTYVVNIVVMVTGVGSQFLAIATGVLVMAVMGIFNVHHHGSINIAVIILYALTSCMLNSALSANGCDMY